MGKIDKPLVSIIVPIYNVEKYLVDCLTSIVNQTYRNIEIILVDDMSPDNSGSIVDEWASKDSRIRVVHKPKNEGLNMARATGFSHSSGDLITFIDSDDKVTVNYVEKLVSLHVKTDADIAMCGYVFYDAGLNTPLPVQPFTQHSVMEEPSVYTQDQMLNFYFSQWSNWRHNNNTTTAYCKLYKRKVIEKINWIDTDYSIGEDDFETIYAFSEAEKYAVINDQMYFYRMNPGSISNAKDFIPKYRGKPVSVFEICRDYEKKAIEQLGDYYMEGIYYRLFSMYQYYIDLLLKKGSLSASDITYFDDFFPIARMKAIKKYPIDKNALSSIEEGGLALYLISRLRKDNQAARSKVLQLETAVALKDAEILSHLSIIRSAKLTIGNMKRKIIKPKKLT